MSTATQTPGVHTVSGLQGDVTAAYSGREFSNGRYRAFLDKAGIEAASLVKLKQVHGAGLVRVSGDKQPGPDCQADGMVTDTPGVTLGIRTADCVPVFCWDPDKRVVGLAHAGWRGVHHAIVEKLVLAVVQNFRSQVGSLQIAFGPAIRKCCYAVGEEFAEHFPEFYDAKTGHMDLIAAVTAQVKSCGVSTEHIFDSGFCTVCDNDRFFSARAEKGTAQRMLSVIQIPPV